MRNFEKWIWLPKEIYPESQTTLFAGPDGCRAKDYAVVDFKRTYSFSKNIACVTLRFSGDTAFRLYCNGEFVATGPASVGGDFIGNDKVRDNFYYYETVIYPKAKELDFFATVRMMPTQICDFSKGKGGFMLFAVVTFEDGTKEVVSTDETWLVRKNHCYCGPNKYNSELGCDEFVNAELSENIWCCEKAPIPPRVQEELCPENGVIFLKPDEEKELVLELDKIYAGFVRVCATTTGRLDAEIACRELDEADVLTIKTSFNGDGEYLGFTLCSVGNFVVKVKNTSSSDAQLKVSLVSTCYPVDETADTITSDADLNTVFEVCKHTLKYCRQTHHLDSPKHCEPLACTGDYYIESLMTLFSFGDMRLAEFDIIRTAELLLRHNGKMFHTTYSLIWVRMLLEVYMITGNKALLEDCESALIILLNRFETYIGENGLIETPPDYMFVDWIYIDGISMHHPPKTLGQTCLNMYYFDALKSAEKIFAYLGENALAQKCSVQKENLQRAVNDLLFDKEKQIYFDGLNTPTPEELIYDMMPRNVSKRYYLKQSNILAAYVGICDEETRRALIQKIMNDEIEGDVQPYFMHYLFEAVYSAGLRDEYTLTLAERWKAPVADCEKGLVEGFVAPEPTYRFDHSHAWGGTPLYSVPKAIFGMEIVKPGMTEIRLSPSLIGLESARTELLTPHGKVTCTLEKGKEPCLTVPEGIEVVLIPNKEEETI